MRLMSVTSRYNRKEFGSVVAGVVKVGAGVLDVVRRLLLEDGAGMMAKT